MYWHENQIHNKKRQDQYEQKQWKANDEQGQNNDMGRLVGHKQMRNMRGRSVS